MKAMIFAAGLGTRLKPFTLKHPKALAPVGDVPMLQRVILKLKSYGINEMVVNVHHFADQIIDFLADNHWFDCKIHISDERSLLLDTGGGILASRRWLDDSPFVVHNADILTDLDLDSLFTYHNDTNSDATLFVAPRDTKRYLLFDQAMSLKGWTNISTGQVRPDGLDTDGLERLAFGGIHVLSPDIFGPLSRFRGENTPFSIIDFYIDSCSQLSIKGYESPTPYHWLDIGKPESLSKANTMIDGICDIK